MPMVVYTEDEMIDEADKAVAEACREMAAERDALRDRRDELHGMYAAAESERAKLDNALREKDRAMGVLFERCRVADIDVSDLVP